MDALRRDIRQRMADYLKGQMSLEDVLGWELQVNDDNAPIPDDLRSDLDRIALIGQEIAMGFRPETELRDLALELTEETGARRRA
jgi:hypothetical protein